MSQKKFKKFSASARLAVVCALSLSLSSCGGLWDWMWTRDYGAPLETNDLIVDDQNTSDDINTLFENAVTYRGAGSTHTGTDIYYLGEKGSPNEHRIIVIDAGHQTQGSSELEPNGPDSIELKAEVTWGAKGVYTGQAEYDLNLRVALLLRDELIKRGYSVVMIRETNNVHISNMERAQIANKYQADAYVRIHANSWTDEEMHGAMTICQSEQNPYPDCAAHYDQSALLSLCILDEFCARTGITKLNMREMDNMTGTNWSRVPTTIVEMGFLSNTMDDKLMATDFFRLEAAIGIANGLDLYFESTYVQVFDEFGNEPQETEEVADTDEQEEDAAENVLADPDEAEAPEAENFPSNEMKENQATQEITEPTDTAAPVENIVAPDTDADLLE